MWQAIVIDSILDLIAPYLVLTIPNPPQNRITVTVEKYQNCYIMG